jgi:outer membrane protein OmpA-like peptidoglycan-associated protein
MKTGLLFGAMMGRGDGADRVSLQGPRREFFRRAAIRRSRCNRKDGEVGAFNLQSGDAMMLRRAVILAAGLFLCAAAATAAEARFTLFFDQRSASLTEAAREVVAYAAKDIRDKGVRHVAIVGHADTADLAPIALSRFRAQAVAAELRRVGVPESVTFAVSGVGAEQLAVPTGPDVREPLNRIVAISY